MQWWVGILYCYMSAEWGLQVIHSELKVLLSLMGRITGSGSLCIELVSVISRWGPYLDFGCSNPIDWEPQKGSRNAQTPLTESPKRGQGMLKPHWLRAPKGIKECSNPIDWEPQKGSRNAQTPLTKSPKRDQGMLYPYWLDYIGCFPMDYDLQHHMEGNTKISLHCVMNNML